MTPHRPAGRNIQASFADFEPPLYAFNTHDKGRVFGVTRQIALNECCDVPFDDSQFITDFAALRSGVFCVFLQRFQVLKDQLVCDVLAHGRTIAATNGPGNRLAPWICDAHVGLHRRSYARTI